MTKRVVPRSRVERLAPALDFALLALSLWAAAAIFISPKASQPSRAMRAELECSALFDCEFRLATKRESRR